MRLDNSAGDTSMKRRKEKQLPLSSPGTVKTEYRMKTVRRNKQTNKKKMGRMQTSKGGTGVKLRFECEMKEAVKSFMYVWTQSLVRAHLFCEKETAGCDLERRETTALEVIWGGRRDRVTPLNNPILVWPTFILLTAFIEIIAFYNPLNHQISIGTKIFSISEHIFFKKYILNMY